MPLRIPDNGEDQGIQTEHRCGQCGCQSVRYYEVGGVWLVRQRINAVRVRERMVVGVPCLACTEPGCLWAMPLPGVEQRAWAQAWAVRRWPVREYIEGRISLHD